MRKSKHFGEKVCYIAKKYNYAEKYSFIAKKFNYAEKYSFIAGRFNYAELYQLSGYYTPNNLKFCENSHEGGLRSSDPYRVGIQTPLPIVFI